MYRSFDSQLHQIHEDERYIHNARFERTLRLYEQFNANKPIGAKVQKVYGLYMNPGNDSEKTAAKQALDRLGYSVDEHGELCAKAGDVQRDNSNS